MHQIIEARLLDDPANSSAAPTTVRFTANISAQQERGIPIQQIITADGTDLANDTVVAIDRIQRGIMIKTDTVLNSISVGPAADPRAFPMATPEKPTCFVTIDLLYPLDRSLQEFWGFDQILGFQPLILACNVGVTGRDLLWKPTNIAIQWLGIIFSRLKVTDRLLAHLTAKGNFILSAERPLILLDGEGFGKRSRAGTIDVALPSGDGRKGGDFEMWFWLAPVKSNATSTIDASGFANRQVRGRVLDPAGAPLRDQTVTLTGTIPTFPPRNTVTNADGAFAFTDVPPGKVPGLGRGEWRSDPTGRDVLIAHM